MSIHWDEASDRYVIRFRDSDGTNRAVTVNTKNLISYGQHLPDRITERVARRLEAAILTRETTEYRAGRSVERQRLLWLDVVARYLPPLLDKNGNDTWEGRPVGQHLENEKTYSHNQLDRMQRVLTLYFPSYLEHDEVKWNRNGKRKHHRAAKVYGCSRRIGSISREDVAGFQIHLTNEGNMGPSTVRGYVATLKTFLLWCNKRGYIPVNPGADVKLPSRKRHEVRWLEANQAKKLREVVKGCLLEGPVQTILGLGLRRSEMINLEWSDINFDAGIVRVRGTKTDRALREIPLPRMLASYFKTLKRLEQVQNVLLNDRQRPWNRNSLNSALRRFRAAKYFPLDWNFQMLRATYGSLLVQQGVPIAHVSMALGHADVRITQDWYIGLKSTHVAPEISNAINKALS